MCIQDIRALHHQWIMLPRNQVYQLIRFFLLQSLVAYTLREAFLLQQLVMHTLCETYGCFPTETSSTGIKVNPASFFGIRYASQQRCVCEKRSSGVHATHNVSLIQSPTHKRPPAQISKGANNGYALPSHPPKTFCRASGGCTTPHPRKTIHINSYREEAS